MAKSWEDDLPPEYKPDFETFGGNKSEEFKKHCFAKHCWANKDKQVPFKGITWAELFLQKYGQTVGNYRHETRALAEKRALQALNDWRDGDSN